MSRTVIVLSATVAFTVAFAAYIILISGTSVAEVAQVAQPNTNMERLGVFDGEAAKASPTDLKLDEKVEGMQVQQIDESARITVDDWTVEFPPPSENLRRGRKKRTGEAK